MSSTKDKTRKAARTAPRGLNIRPGGDMFPEVSAGSAGGLYTAEDIRRRYGSARTLGADDDARLAADAALEEGGVFDLISHSLELGQIPGVQFAGYAALQSMAQNGLLRACVETVADDMTRSWIKLKRTGGETGQSDSESESGAELIAAVEEDMRKYRLQDVFHRALELVGYEGGAMIYVDTGARGADLLTPLTYTSGNAEWRDGGLRRFTVVDPINVFPGTYNSTDPLAPDYFSPKTWWVQSRQVHASRLIRLVANECPLLLKPSYNFFGIAQAQILWDYVVHFQTCRVAASDLLTKFSTTVFKTSMAETLFAAGGEQNLRRRLDMFMANRKNGGIVAIDQETEDLVKIETPITGVADLVRQALEFLAALNRTPAVKLLGISPSGFNATGESDIKNYYDYVKSQQEKVMRDALRKCLTAVQLSRFGRADKGLTFDFAPLSEEDKTKLAAYQQTRAGVLTSLLDGGVISPEEARKALSSDTDSGFSGIDPDDVPEQQGGEDGGMGGMEGMAGVPGMGDTPAPELEEPSAASEPQNPKGDIPR